MGIGLHTIFQSQDGTAEVDIVAVHGLNFKNKPNHGTETWTRGDSLWLRDFLPQAIAKPCRVMLFEYNSSPAFGASAMNLDDHATSLLHWLNLERKVSPQRPLIFICHSLGGLVTKQALVQAKLDDALKSIVNATRLLVFFATPHQGGNYASVGDIAAKLLRTALLKPSHDLLEALKRNSNEATRRAEQSRHIYERCLIVSFFERQPYGKAGIRSATLNLPSSREKQVPMDSDHSSICKFNSTNSPMCKLALGIIKAEYEHALGFGAINTHWLVPGSVNSLFIGRDDIVGRIKNALLPEIAVSIQKRFVLTGMAGQGKSEVCLKVANELRDLFWGIFWVDVSNETTTAAGFTKIADMLGLGASDINHTCLMLANSSPEKSWLLILDNADDLDTDYQRYIPSGTRGAVLLTSRVSSCSVHATVGSEELHNLSEQECTTLLLKGSGVSEQAWKEYVPAAKSILSILGSHTLGLLQAAAYISSGHCSLAEYPNHFQQQRKRLLEHNPKQARSRYGNIYAIFEAAVQVLKPFEAESPPDSLLLLGLLSAFHHENFPMDIFEAAWSGAQNARVNPPDDEDIGHLSVWHINQLPTFLVWNSFWDPFRLNSAIAQLESLALIKRNSVKGCSLIKMHPLTHSWITTRVQQDQNRTSSYLRMAACITGLSYYEHKGSKLFWQYLGPHLDILIQEKKTLTSTKDYCTPMLQVFTQFTWILYLLRDFQKSEQLLHWISQQLNTDLESPTEKFLCLNDLAAIYLYSNGEIKKTVNMSEDLLRIRERTLDVSDEARIASQHNLAKILVADRQTKRAIELFEDVIKIQENLEAANMGRLISQCELAAAFLKDNQTKRAIDLFQHVVTARERTLYPEHPDRLTSEHGLGHAFLADGQTKRAIDLLQYVVTMRERTLNPEHPNRLASEHGLSHAFLADGQTKRAIDLLQYVVTMRERTLNPEHPNRLASEHELSRAFLADGQTKRAIDLLQHVVTMEETTLDPEHPDRLGSQYWLAKACAKYAEETNAANSVQEEPESSSRFSKRFGKLVQRFRQH